MTRQAHGGRASKLFLLLFAFGALAHASCKGPTQPSIYTDYTHLDYDGQTGGAARVGFNIPLGTGFRDPASHSAGTVEKQQLAASLAILEHFSDDRSRGASATSATPGPGPSGPAGPGLHVDPQDAAAPLDEEDDEHLDISHVTETREELEAWSWRTVGMLAVLGLVSLSLWAAYKATGKYLKD